MVLTNQLIYLLNVKTTRKIFQIMCASQKVRTLHIRFPPYSIPKALSNTGSLFFQIKGSECTAKKREKKSTSLMAKKNFLHFSGSNWSRNLYNSHEILNFFILQKNLKISILWVAKNDRFLWLRISAAKSWNSVPLLEM